MTTCDGGYTGHAFQGPKYDRTRYVQAAEIARNVRREIKEAVQAGQLPGKDVLKFSVRSESFAGGQAVNIHVIGVQDDDDTAWAFRPITADDWREQEYGLTRVVTDEAKQIGELVRSFGRAYVRDDSDGQIDYFDVSCYITVYLGATGLCL